MATLTLPTRQQQAVAVLTRILATPGLAEVTWTIWPDRLTGGRPELVGQLHDFLPAAEARAAIDGYALAFGLDLDDDRCVSQGEHCAAFTQVGASGVVDGVQVKVWGAAR